MRFLLPLLLVACSGAPVDPEEPAPDAADEIAPAPADDAGEPEAAPEADAAPAPSCGKHVTALFAVGTGAGALRDLAGACWDVVDADGSANKSWRKCSASTWTVKNETAPNWALDDTNPNAPLSDDQSLLDACAKGATGIGFEYMAYRGSWRLLFPANHLKAFFAELYAGDGDIDDYWPAHYVNNAQLGKHTVYPMINIGPTNVASPAAKIQKDALAMCKTIKNGGYLGVYVGTWDQPMTKTDARAVALAKALDACTK